MPKLQPIRSNNLVAASYDPQTKVAIVQFKNDVFYQYSGVSPAVWAGFEATFNTKASSGNYLAKNIKSLPFERLTKEQAVSPDPKTAKVETPPKKAEPTTKAGTLAKAEALAKSDFTPVPATKEVTRTVPEPKPKPAAGQKGTKRQAKSVKKAVTTTVKTEVVEFAQPAEVVVGRFYEISPLEGPRVYGELIDSQGKTQTVAIWGAGRLTDKIGSFDFTAQPVREIDRTMAFELTTHAQF